MKRDHLLIFLKQLEQSQGDDVPCNIAGWKGNGVYGPFMTIEISPRFERRAEVIDADPFPGFIGPAERPSAPTNIKTLYIR